MAVIGKFTPDGLIAGDFPLEAQEITIVGPADFKRGDVIGIDGDGAYALADSTATNGLQNPIGIICDNVIVGTGESKVATMYVKGEFNRRFLQFGGTDNADIHLRRMTEIGLIIRETKIGG